MNVSFPSPVRPSPPVLIAGATSEIGMHLNREFARNGHPLVLVAPRLEELEDVAVGLRSEFGVAVHALGCDLREPGAADDIQQWLFSNGIMIGVLVNSADVRVCGTFLETPISAETAMLHTNLEAPLRLAKRLIPLFLQTGGGKILTVMAEVADEPAASAAVYGATRSFLRAWSDALATEFEDAGVTVTFVCPAPASADFSEVFGDRDSSSFSGPSLEEMARLSYEASLQGRRFCTPARGRASSFASRLTPASMAASADTNGLGKAGVLRRRGLGNRSAGVPLA